MKIDENRIVYEKNGEEVGVLEFQNKNEGVIDIYHTYVNPDYQGQQIASKLVEELIKKVKRENKRITSSCSYGDYWMKKHPEYSDYYK